MNNNAFMNGSRENLDSKNFLKRNVGGFCLYFARIKVSKMLIQLFIFTLLMNGVRALASPEPVIEPTYREKEKDFARFLDLKSNESLNFADRMNPQSQVYFLDYPNENVPDEFVGYRPRSSSQIRQVARTKDRIVYDKIYSFDAYGRRYAKILDGKSRKKFVLLYGCSFVYGNGLNDDETLSYHLGKIQKEFFPYNYGVGGSSAHMLLAKLENTNLAAEIPQDNGVLIYVFLDEHIPRASGHYPFIEWLKDTPFYEMQSDGSLKRSGTFATGRPIFTKALFFLNKVYLFLGMGSRVFPRVSNRDTEYFCALVENSRQKFLLQYPRGKFIFYAHPFTKVSDVLQDCLTKRGVTVATARKMPTEGVNIEFDGHPNSYANKLIAEDLAQLLENTKLEP